MKTVAPFRSAKVWADNCPFGAVDAGGVTGVTGVTGDAGVTGDIGGTVNAGNSGNVDSGGAAGSSGASEIVEGVVDLGGVCRVTGVPIPGFEVGSTGLE